MCTGLMVSFHPNVHSITISSRKSFTCQNLDVLSYWNQNRLLLNNDVSTTSTQTSNTVVTIYNPMGSNVKSFNSLFTSVSGNISNIFNGTGGGRWNSTTAITGVRFLQLTGNITARKIRIYGIKNS